MKLHTHVIIFYGKSADMMQCHALLCTMWVCPSPGHWPAIGLHGSIHEPLECTQQGKVTSCTASGVTPMAVLRVMNNLLASGVISFNPQVMKAMLAMSDPHNLLMVGHGLLLHHSSLVHSDKCILYQSLSSIYI